MSEAMQDPSTKSSQTRLLSRIRPGLERLTISSDDRRRIRMVVDRLILHLHPPKVPVFALRWIYTWGLGGLSTLLMVILGVSGMILLNN